ncbi:uncharacterized protein C8R40DRAFT_1093427 [Lentinula edodes]|uniref:uncharacterized protein n=1 Tax=Lentinula edodes TaxID=5353 RepID=UPI001E8E8873|nr:uncharacterized protein C8R40DRAFT_1093427 [Lentinula edodes]KAH7878018.1 hypothetical protein C8R40DRAFT_1093427 [Lentinula edodes]
MDNNSNANDGQQRSTLPRSLIPHLYSAPQTSRDSSTRTTLSEQEEIEEEDTELQEQQRSASPFALRPIPSEYPSESPPLASRRYPSSYSAYDHSVQPPSGPEMRLPPTAPAIRNESSYHNPRPAHVYNFPQIEMQQSYVAPTVGSSWREGEAGPSTITQRGHPSETRGRSTVGYVPPYRYMDQYQQQPHHRESYSRQHEPYHYGAYTQGHSLPQHGTDSFLSPMQAHRQVPEHIYGGNPPQPVHQDLYTFPPSGQQPESHGSVARGWGPMIASSSTAAADYADSSYPSLPPLPHPSRYSTEPEDDDGEYLPPGRRNQKRKLENDEQEPGSRPKKTLIACDFCRGRKLRCDGTRPSCSNCKSRDNQPCVYQSHPRRRGPGKAPKGQRKKIASNRAETTTPASERSRASNEGSQHYSPSGDDFEVDALPPDFRSQQQQQHLPPILPYPGPQGGLILPSSSQIPQGQPHFPPQSQDQGRFQQVHTRRGLRDSAVIPHPLYPDDGNAEHRSERTDNQWVRQRNI